MWTGRELTKSAVPGAAAGQFVLHRRTSCSQVVGIRSAGLEFGTRKAELAWLIRTEYEVGTREAMFGVAGAYRARVGTREAIVPVHGVCVT